MKKDIVKMNIEIEFDISDEQTYRIAQQLKAITMFALDYGKCEGGMSGQSLPPKSDYYKKIREEEIYKPNGF